MSIKVQNDLKKDLNQILNRSQTNSATSAKQTDPNFLDTLQAVHDSNIKERLDQLLADIDQQGQKLGHQRTFKELVRYKNMVKQFMKEAVDQMYEVKEEYSGYRSGNHKVYNLVEKVDESLEELTDLVLSEQEAQLEILDRLDEIKGMLVDIYS
ncbi:MAG: YaaR family protein [Bacillota bacterium]